MIAAHPVPKTVASAYRRRARDLAERVREAWEHSPRADIKSLVDDVQCALVEEANHELRQVLFQISAQLELALVKMHSGKGTLEAADIEKLLAATHRATATVDAYLDRGEAAKLVIPLARTRFDLGRAMEDMLRWNGFLGDEGTEVFLESIEVDADRERLVGVLSHMASRFFFARRKGQRMRITLHDAGERVEGFIGLNGARLHPVALMAEFDHPLRVEDMEIDMPYTRAVIERHGGTIFVATDRDGADGFAFILPTHPPQES